MQRKQDRSAQATPSLLSWSATEVELAPSALVVSCDQQSKWHGLRPAELITITIPIIITITIGTATNVALHPVWAFWGLCQNLPHSL